MSNAVKTVKVKPYPIPIKIISSSHTVDAKILKLTIVGVIAELPDTSLQVHEKHLIQGSLPLQNVQFSEQVSVIKTYDQYLKKTENGAEIQHLVELHFVKLSTAAEQMFVKFLRSIGQTA
ncbi:MAG: hypothetical protein K2X47_14650 [Bdellovibrionales bacterium]|nr:hypothetical protein [Bdellovibrionales bacterium]